MASFNTDIEIARGARLRPIQEIAARLGVPSKHVLAFGRDKAKLSGQFTDSLGGRPDGKLILVTGVNPTPPGEGKTTTTVGLGDALSQLGNMTAICLREPSLGPCFGMKGGATGGGRAQVVPMEDINLHFTGDFHAIAAAHNLLAALVDNSIHWRGNAGIDTRRVVWRRVLDTNDRALRQIVSSLGGVRNGFPRETGFDITAASEIMAILCLASDLRDLRRRLGKIIVGYRRDRSPVFCRDLSADGAMSVLLRDAMQPNLAQTIENTPAFIHGGPFANIAHGCNSVIATKTALKLADYVVTEAGFGADLGAEKFFNIKCRGAGLNPEAAVIVATVRALKWNGGAGKDNLAAENAAAVEKGCANLGRHIDNVRQFGVPTAVAINRFATDTDDEVATIQSYVRGRGIEAIPCTHWADGSAGAEALARHVIAMLRKRDGRFAPLYPAEMPLLEKMQVVARRIYHADGIEAGKRVRSQLSRWDEAGYCKLPVCMAKTQYSFSADPKLLGSPSGHSVPVREVRLSSGAGFVVAICGEIMTMPGLPRLPAAESMRVTDDGLVEGLG
ncbi:MAG: formate--tetrahydrofolate ligase [Acidobacteriia bacterium]|nr:formate--tetrahydrofolate ligase [Terriglobia bacterium]